MRFVRYQAATANHRGHHVGVFGLANGLAAEGRLSEQEHRWWSASNAWLDQAYPDPAISDPEVFNRRVHPLVSCWFKRDALHLIERVPGYLQLLDAHCVPWRRVLSDDPGRVLYEDEVQVVVAPG
ncbi:hypothetical protein [Quadrisphaera sp. INWT6]|uniref:hypothetical protein n=1 Tax=Quadrisphaera sp. INWT6 TaxID=2596917 RepID=UPI0018924509|nr:hypothetical protein [Quadrisphaera sp. INWT6]MBF5083450.1 hypothetical protein [Quadrisphaera sp. INWT6]